MIPYLDIPSLHVGSWEVRPFGLLVSIGIVVGFILAKRRALRVGLHPGIVRQLVKVCAFFGITGSHVVHVLAYHPDQLRTDPWALFKFWDGMSSYGGFISVGIAASIYMKRKRVPFLPYSEAVLFGFFPAWFFGRLGCSTAHDHPGCLSDFALAVRFPGGSRHDLGLYEVMLSFVWIPFMHWMGRKQTVNDPPAGTILWSMMIAYSVPRFFLDFLRATDLPSSDVRYMGLTPAQYACIAFTAVAAWWLVRQRRRAA